MYFSSVGGNLFKAQVQNHYEKIRCELYIKDAARRRIHSLSNINNSIKELRDTLKDIQASSGYCNETQENETASKSNVWKERERRTRKSQPGNPGRSETQARRKKSAFQEIKSKNADSGKQTNVRKTSSDGVRCSILSRDINEWNSLEVMEYCIQGRNGAGSETSGDRSDIVPAGRVLRDEMLPDSRNMTGGVIKGTKWQQTDSAVSAKNSGVKELQGRSQGKANSSANGGNFQNTSTKLKSLGTNEPPECATGSSKLGRHRPNSGSDGYPNRTAPDKESRFKMQVKRAPTSKGELNNNSTSTYSSSSDAKKEKIHVSLSRTERKRILQEFISSCAAPCDRSALERERQRLLQEKIRRFFELLFGQDNKDHK